MRALRSVVHERGYTVTGQQLAINRSGHRLFGVMDLEATPPPDTLVIDDNPWGFAIGFRNSTDESLGIRLVAGVRVVVCDNLALSGDLIALKRRNTTRLDLVGALDAGFGRYLTHARALNDQIATLQAAVICATGEARLYDLFAHRVLRRLWRRHRYPSRPMSR